MKVSCAAAVGRVIIWPVNSAIKNASRGVERTHWPSGMEVPKQ